MEETCSNVEVRNLRAENGEMRERLEVVRSAVEVLRAGGPRANVLEILESVSNLDDIDTSRHLDRD